MRLVSVLMVAMLTGVACSSGPSPTAPSASLTAPSTTAAATTSGDLVAVADPACRASSFSGPGTLTLSAIILGDLVTIVYADPEGDWICQYSPQFFGEGAPVVQRANAHLADQLNADTPMVRDPYSSGSSQTGTYVWGAVGPEVASVVIEIPGTDQRIEAQIAGGYFLAVVGPVVGCCVVIAVALDADGQEIARAE